MGVMGKGSRVLAKVKPMLNHHFLRPQVIRLFSSVIVMLAIAMAAFGEVKVSPPPLPVYTQPVCPGEGHIWTPGYWAWNDAVSDYYWVPGTWVLAPETGLLWTPAYWSREAMGFVFHEGFWAQGVGFYGGIFYGFGYFGVGYSGGRWRDGNFFYNRAVNNVNVVDIHHVYNLNIVINGAGNHASYNGDGGIDAHATPQEESTARGRHLSPVRAQAAHVLAAREDPQLRASVNQGTPPIAATQKPGELKGPFVERAPQAASTRGLDPEQPATLHAQNIGPYYALIIGIQNYADPALPSLRTSVSDARDIEKSLRTKYGFHTSILLDEDATRHAIKQALSEFRKTLPENSNLLIYYAGHGYYDKSADKAYWLPVDAESTTDANWIIADDITAEARAIPAKHVLIVSDSCYSGGLTRDVDLRMMPSDRNLYVQKMQVGKSRTLMASGGLEPVADGGSSGHSVFANAFLRGLEEITVNPFTAEDLFQQFIRIQVAGGSDQIPHYMPIRNSAHDDGDFVFVRH